MTRILKLIVTALAAWLIGLGAIVLSLYFGNGGSDFTLTDVMGFGVLYVIASGLLMLVVYLPGLLWFRRKAGRRRLAYPLFCGLFLNLPVIILLGLLIGRKMAASEAITFMLIFVVAGIVFGIGFRWANPGREMAGSKKAA